MARTPQLSYIISISILLIETPSIVQRINPRLHYHHLPTPSPLPSPHPIHIYSSSTSRPSFPNPLLILASRRQQIHHQSLHPPIPLSIRHDPSSRLIRRPSMISILQSRRWTLWPWGWQSILQRPSPKSVGTWISRWGAQDGGLLWHRVAIQAQGQSTEWLYALLPFSKHLLFSFSKHLLFSCIAFACRGEIGVCDGW